MKRFSAHALSLLVLFACLAPAIATAKSRHLPAKTSRTAAAKVKVEAAGPPPLPDRNPNRAASSDSTTPPPVAAGPQTITVTPQPVQGDATTTGSVGLTSSNVAPTDALAASQVLTPPDLEALIGLPNGHIFHGELAPDQLFFMRPVPGLARYRTPVRGLWLCGAATHPGGGIMGACGWNAAREILRDRRS